MLNVETQRCERAIRAAIRFRKTCNRRACCWRMLRRVQHPRLSHSAMVWGRVVDTPRWPKAA